MRDHILSELAEAKAIADRTLRFFKGALDNYKEEIEFFGSVPTMYAGLVDRKGNLQLYDGDLRFRSAAGEIVEDQIPAEDYPQLDRRSQPARIVLEGAFLQAAWDFPVACIALARWAAECCRPVRDSKGRCRIPRIPPAVWQPWRTVLFSITMPG